MTPSTITGGYNDVPYDPNPLPVAPEIPSLPDVGVEGWIDKLKKDLGGKTTGPKLPAQVNLDKYRTEMATIKDIEKKFGFDYSRSYANKQAEVMAQAQKDAIASQRERMEYETESAKTDLQHDFFNQYLQQRQELSDRGLNAGISAERDLRLEMNRQHVLADILANAQLRGQELDRDEARIVKEALAYAEQLYNERLQQGFSNAMDYSRFQQSENQWRAQMAMAQRQQTVEERWREHEWNNMSYSDKQKILIDAEKYGMDKAWEKHKFEAGLAFEAGMAGGVANVGNLKTSKGTPPASFQQHLATAAQMAGIPQGELQPLAQLVANESSWNPKAKNPRSSAHGYAQFLSSTRKAYEKKTGLSYDDPVNQLVMMYHYIKDRYGSAQKALQFWNKNKWY